jgi:hypothetical protein
MDFWLLVLYVLPVAVIAIPLMVFTRRRVSWWLLDVIAIALPGPLWLLLNFQDSSGRSLSNIIELPILALLASLGVGVRALLGTRLPRLGSSLLLFLALVGTTLCFYYLFPTLPE